MKINAHCSSMRLLSTLGIVLSLMACSESDEIPPAPEPPRPEEPAPSPQPEPQPDNAAPEATIIFPSQLSKTIEDTITVRGYSNDQTDVTRVSVNGEDAILEFNGEQQRTNWVAAIPFSNTITIETEDSLGNVDMAAASANLVDVEIPFTFSVDKVNHQFFGSLDNDRILKRNLITGEEEFHQAIYPDSFGRPRFFHYISKEGKLAAIDDCCEGSFYLALADIGDFEFNTEFQYEVPKTYSNWLFKHTRGVYYDPTDNVLYVNFSLFFESTLASHIIRYDFETKHVTVIADGVDSDGNIIAARDMTYSDGVLYLATDSETGLQELPLDTRVLESHTNIHAYFPGEVLSTPGHEDTVYVIGFDDVVKLDTTTREIASISKQVDQSDLFLAQFFDNDIDEYNNQILVNDHDLDMIMGIAIDTGKRSRFIHSGVGFGKAIINPWALTIDEERNIIYVFDSGGNAPETILAVDMSTGDRREIGNVDRRYNWETNALVLDAESNMLYAIFPDQVTTVYVDTNATEVLTGNEYGAGVDTGWLDNGVLDKSENRLLVTDDNRIIAIDLTTGYRSILSSAEDSVGNGEPFGRIGALAIDPFNRKLIATGVVADKPGLFEVDLMTGNRTLMENICADVPTYFDIEFYDTYYAHHPIVLDPTNNELHLFGKEMFTLNLKTNECIANEVDYGWDVAKTSLGQWFSVTQNELIQFDVASNERVVISK